MGATDAERQRRYRARKKAHSDGDHSLCDPERCPDVGGVTVTDPVTAPVTRDVSSRLRERGQRLWRDLDGDDLTGGRRVLAEEACRLADRLDALDRLISGDARDWVEIITTKGDPDRQEVVIDKVLAESRQQASVLKQLVAELRQSGGVEEPDQGVDFLDQLAAQREKRLANAAGS